jgi:hypothetical protein
MYKFASLIKGFLIIAAVAFTQLGNAVTLYVNTNGNDNWSGALKTPNKTKTMDLCSLVALVIGRTNLTKV